MKKIKGYTRKDFIIARNIAIFFTVLYLTMPYILALVNYIVGISDAVEIVVIMVYLFLPIIILLSWIMCMERYLYLEIQSIEKASSGKRVTGIWASVVIMAVLGSIVFLHIKDILSFLTENYSDISQLYDCVAIKLVITFGWIFGFIYSIKRRRKISVMGNALKRKIAIIILVIGIFLVLSCVGHTYVEDRLEDIWFEQLFERYPLGGEGNE